MYLHRVEHNLEHQPQKTPFELETLYSTVGERQQCLCELSLGMMAFPHSRKICTVS